MYSCINVGNTWIQKGFIFFGILIVFGSLVIFYEENHVVKQALFKTIKRMKTFGSHGIMGESSEGNYSGDYFRFDKTPAVKDKNTIAPPFIKDPNVLIQHRFQGRQQLRDTICKSGSYKNMTNGTNLNGRLAGLGGGLIKWCRIPKVGSTYLLGLEKKVLREIGKKAGSTPKTRTMLVVREPYSRIVSGYIGKIVTNPPWAQSHGSPIVRKFRPTASDQAKRCGSDVTFPEFLKYIIEAELTGWHRNLHFVPMYKQCNPCATSYDYIVHLETFKDDLSFALHSVNITVDMDFSDEEQTLKGKARSIVSHKDRILKCESMCSALSKVWWSFHSRGLISTDIKFPLSNEACIKINDTEFADLAWDAHIQSTGRINKAKQRREAMAGLYLQASLTDRMKVRELLLKDFELYGYDSKPPDIFPELYNKL